MRYKRLPGKKSGFFRKCTLYRGEDHFLSVESNIYTEEYFRFHFSEIQAFISKKTDRGKIWSVILGFSALIFTTFTINAAAPPAGGESTFFGTVAGIFIIAFIYNLWLGPTCSTWVQTAVTVHELPALGRARRRRRFLAVVRPLIEKVQGPVDPGRIQEIRSAPPAPPEVFPPADFPSPRPVEPAAEPETSGLPVNNAGPVHGIMFGALILSAGLDLYWIIFPSFPALFFSLLFTLVVLISIVTALVVQSQRRMTSAIRKITWTAMIGFVVTFLTNYVLSMGYLFRNIGMIRNGAWEYYSTLAQEGLADMPLMAGFSFFCAAFFLILGALGFFVMIREKVSGKGSSSRKPFAGKGSAVR